MSNINSPLSQSAEIKILTERQHTKTMFHNFSGFIPHIKKRNLYVLILASIREYPWLPACPLNKENKQAEVTNVMGSHRCVWRPTERNLH